MFILKSFPYPMSSRLSEAFPYPMSSRLSAAHGEISRLRSRWQKDYARDDNGGVGALAVARCTVAVVFRLLHTLKILLYLYINIEIIFHSHTTLISNCNTATRNGFYLKCSAKTTFFQKSVVCVQHFYLYFHPIRYNYGKENIRKNNALGR